MNWRNCEKRSQDKAITNSTCKNSLGKWQLFKYNLIVNRWGDVIYHVLIMSFVFPDNYIVLCSLYRSCGNALLESLCSKLFALWYVRKASQKYAVAPSFRWEGALLPQFNWTSYLNLQGEDDESIWVCTWQSWHWCCFWEHMVRLC